MDLVHIAHKESITKVIDWWTCIEEDPIMHVLVGLHIAVGVNGSTLVDL